MHQIIFLILAVLSHIGSSLFFAKPRFNKFIIAIKFTIVNMLQLNVPIYCPNTKLYGIQTKTDNKLRSLNKNPLDIKARGNRIPANIGRISQGEV